MSDKETLYQLNERLRETREAISKLEYLNQERERVQKENVILADYIDKATQGPLCNEVSISISGTKFSTKINADLALDILTAIYADNLRLSTELVK